MKPTLTTHTVQLGDAERKAVQAWAESRGIADMCTPDAELEYFIRYIAETRNLDAHPDNVF